MNEPYPDLRSLYGAARRDEEPTRADRCAVRAAIMSAGGSVVSLYVTSATGKLISLLPGTAKVLTLGQVIMYATIGATIGGGVAAVGAVVSQPTPASSQLRHSTHGQSRLISPGQAATYAPPVASLDVTTTTSSSGQIESLPGPERASNGASLIRVTPAAGADHQMGLHEPSNSDPGHVDATPVSTEAAPEASASASTRPSAQPLSLVQETRALAAVQSALSAHDADRALRLLDAQDRDFTAGSLAQERAAARVLALCAAGQAIAAQAAKQRFLAAYPGSPLARRIGTACEK